MLDIFFFVSEEVLMSASQDGLLYRVDTKSGAVSTLSRYAHCKDYGAQHGLAVVSYA